MQKFIEIMLNNPENRHYNLNRKINFSMEELVIYIDYYFCININLTLKHKLF